jgi:hypothetical protein
MDGTALLICFLCSWQGLGNMASTEAMRLFVKILEVIAMGFQVHVS